MSSEHSINFQSLNVVRDELIATIEASARELENFVESKQEDAEALQASINGVQQICGILKVLELDSAAMLAEELLTVANSISPGADGVQFNRQIEIISNTFFVLPRYLEYLEQAHRQLPVVLVPHINSLRKLHAEGPLLESHFCKFRIPTDIPLPAYEQLNVDSANLRSELRRARNMYQIGLAGLVREKKIEPAIALMRRGLKRLMRLSAPDAKLNRLWFLANLCLEAMVQQKMAILETRKFLFMRLDRVIRQVELGGAAAMATEPPKGLIKEMLYLLSLSGFDGANVQGLKSVLSSINLPYDENELQKEYAILYGPSAHTISSLAHVLNTEVGSAKRTLENAAQDDVGYIDDLDSFVSVLNNIAEILGVVGLNDASDSLKEQIVTVQGWSKDSSTMTQENMTDVANTFLYLESVIRDLEHSSLNTTGAKGQSGRDAQVASHELASAMQIVKEECLGGLSLTKRALNSFADSNYDTGHIRNISKTLNTIRGAMELLNKERVGNVLERSVAFVEEVLMDDDLPAAINEVLETFADVIISVEYFFDSSDSFNTMDDAVLKVAEESLAALGYESE